LGADTHARDIGVSGRRKDAVPGDGELGEIVDEVGMHPREISGITVDPETLEAGEDLLEHDPSLKAWARLLRRQKCGPPAPKAT